MIDRSIPVAQYYTSIILRVTKADHANVSWGPPEFRRAIRWIAPTNYVN